MSATLLPALSPPPITPQLNAEIHHALAHQPVADVAESVEAVAGVDREVEAEAVAVTTAMVVAVAAVVAAMATTRVTMVLIPFTLVRCWCVAPSLALPFRN